MQLLATSNFDHLEMRTHARALYWRAVTTMQCTASVAGVVRGDVEVETFAATHGMRLLYTCQYPWGGNKLAVVASADAVVLFDAGESVRVEVSSTTTAAAATLLAVALGTVTPPTATPGTVPVDFWSMGAHGPSAYRRLASCPAWGEIAGNYAAYARTALGALMETARPAGGGRLILLSGPPGTGKTYAIRALARAWSPWCDAHYIVDADQYFGSAAYMLHVVAADHSIGSEDRPTADRWRLLVIEDADELITLDAKERSGQALARLLNLTDGMVGQGLNVLVLITTNEPIGRFAPAVVRAGRCRANIECGPLAAEEVHAWYAARGEPAPAIVTPTVLAELYNRAPLTVAPTRRASVGFGG